jgi:hypothetical protein
VYWRNPAYASRFLLSVVTVHPRASRHLCIFQLVHWSRCAWILVVQSCVQCLYTPIQNPYTHHVVALLQNCIWFAPCPPNLARQKEGSQSDFKFKYRKANGHQKSFTGPPLVSFPLFFFFFLINLPCLVPRTTPPATLRPPAYLRSLSIDIFPPCTYYTRQHIL